jgi:uncharacterized membrane protein YfcA
MPLFLADVPWPSAETFLVAIPALTAAYVIFGIAGFGTALIAAPLLAHVMPVAAIVPLLAILDCLAAITMGVRLGDKVAKDELVRLVPLMIVGSLIGAYLLLIIPPRPMMLALGIFIVGYAIYSLIAPPPAGAIQRPWVLAFGTIGGVFSAMFGSGGFIYAMYLGRRLNDKDAIRATQSTLIGLSTFTRVIIFAAAGLYNDWNVLVLATCLVPAMIVGIYVGHRITLRLTREQFLRILYFVLIGTGATLIVRMLAGVG